MKIIGGEKFGQCSVCGTVGQGEKDFICSNCGAPDKVMVVCQCGERYDLTSQDKTPSPLKLGTTLFVPKCISCSSSLEEAMGEEVSLGARAYSISGGGEK